MTDRLEGRGGRLGLMECRICWYVYDPASGDDLAQIPPGTPFADLPDDWHCPRCDAEKHMYLAVDDAD